MCSLMGGMEESGDRLFFARGRCRLVKLTRCTYSRGFEGGLVSGGELEVDQRRYAVIFLYSQQPA